MRDGSRAITRIFDGAEGEYRFTKVGNNLYKERKRNYVVQAPVIVKGTCRLTN